MFSRCASHSRLLAEGFAQSTTITTRSYSAGATLYLVGILSLCQMPEGASSPLYSHIIMQALRWQFSLTPLEQMSISTRRLSSSKTPHAAARSVASVIMYVLPYNHTVQSESSILPCVIPDRVDGGTALSSSLRCACLPSSYSEPDACSSDTDQITFLYAECPKFRLTLSDGGIAKPMGIDIVAGESPIVVRTPRRMKSLVLTFARSVLT